MKRLLVLSAVVGILSMGCVSQQAGDGFRTKQLTAGVVQREIKIGMPAPDVAEALGSPNIVSLDDDRNEVWIYDKFSSEVQTSSSGAGVWLILAGASSQSSSSRSSQRTLTVIVKFDGKQKVRDFTYHASNF